MDLVLVWAVLAVAAAITLINAAFYYVNTYNGLVALKNNTVKAWANIDVLLKQRSDELPNLISAVKGYTEHENQTLTEIARARTTLERAGTVGEKAASYDIITDTLQRLYAVVENYPALKADANFLKLQARITGIENQIADRREFYNDAATIYNIKIETIPDNYVAHSMKAKRIPLFRATEEEKRRIDVIFKGEPTA
jgi:LemA protein